MPHGPRSILPSPASPVPWHVANTLDQLYPADDELRIEPPRVMQLLLRGLGETLPSSAVVVVVVDQVEMMIVKIDVVEVEKKKKWIIVDVLVVEVVKRKKCAFVVVEWLVGYNSAVVERPFADYNLLAVVEQTAVDGTPVAAD